MKNNTQKQKNFINKTFIEDQKNRPLSCKNNNYSLKVKPNSMKEKSTNKYINCISTPELRNNNK